jgi:protein SCO1/2
MKRFALFLAIFLMRATPLFCAEPQAAQDNILKKVSFDQNLSAQVPLDLPFRDETGKSVHLGDYFGRKPVILALVYYECPMLCTETLNGLVRALRSISFDAGKQFNILTVSFNPRDTPALAAAKKNIYVERYGRAGAAQSWAFLTGKEDSIHRLVDAAGFHYAYDSELDQYAHSTGIMVLTPQGKISSYLYGVEYSARDLRLALVDSAAGKIGSPVDQLLLYCYHYDPLTGKYGLLVMRVLRTAAVATVLLLALMVVLMNRFARRKKPSESV